MKTIVRRLPVDLQLLILAKLTIAKIFKFGFSQEVLCHKVLEKRFERECLRNGIPPTKETENIPNALILRRFFYNLRQLDFAEHKRKQWGDRSPESLCDVTNRSISISSLRDFYHGYEDDDTRLAVQITLIRPMNEIERAIMPRNTTIVGCDVDEIDRMPTVSLVLQNRTASAGNTVTYKDKGVFLPKGTRTITFDEYDRPYYCDNRQDRILVFRMDIEADGHSEFVAEFPCGGSIFEEEEGDILIAVGGNMLCVLDGILVYYYDMITTDISKIMIPSLKPPILLTAHQTGLFVESPNWLLILRPGWRNYFYSSVISKVQLSKHTYLYISKGDRKFNLHIVSLVGENVVDYVVQACDTGALYARYNDHIFAVESHGRRHIWYIEEPGAKPTHLSSDKL